MARRPMLEIDGELYKNVEEVSYEIKTAFDETGRPRDKARPGTIKILREADHKGFISDWASKGGDEMKSGKITVRYYTSDQDSKTISFERAFITHYEERVPNIMAKPGQQILEYFEISCGKIVLETSNFTSTLYSPWEDRRG